MQRFDKAVLSVLYLRAVFTDRGLAVTEVDTMVRIRPVTYFIRDFERAFDAIKTKPATLNALCEATGKQSAKLFSEMAEGLTFVTRKTGDTALAQLQVLAAAGQLPADAVAGLAVECGVHARRNGKSNKSEANNSEKTKRIWSSSDERIWYAPMEYLSPYAWNALTATDQATVLAPPLPRAEWVQVNS